MRTVFILLIIGFLTGQAKTFDDSFLNLVQIWLNAQHQYEQIPGISLAIVHDQDILWQGGFGVHNIKSAEPATEHTIYSICSISKLFTSMAIMQLWDKGLLDLDDPVDQLLPWYDLQQRYASSPPITIRNILTHSSGLPRESDFPYWSLPDFPFPTRAQMRERLSQQETLYPADRYFQYSNLGMTLLGEIVAEISGQTFDDYIRAHILSPLGLDDTQPYIPYQEEPQRVAMGVSSLTRDGQRKALPPFQARAITPAAGFSSTVNDLSSFASWQFRLLESTGDSLLSANTLREMQRVHWLDPDWQTTRGFGFKVWRLEDKTFVGHEGSCPGYRSILFMQPREKIAVIFMANASGVDVLNFAHEIYKIIAPALKNTPASNSTGLEDYAGTYSQQPWWGEMAVFPWKEGLGALSIPTDSPLSAIVMLDRVENDLFQRKRDNGEPGESVLFIRSTNGSVKELLWHSTVYPKIE